MKSSIFFLTALFALTTSVHGYFYVPNLMNTLPFKGGMISAQVNNSLYLFGGENATVTYTNDLYKLTQTDSTYTWEVVPQTNAPNGTIYGQGYVTSDNQNMVVMGGVTNATKASAMNLQIYSYNFASQTWTANASNNAVVSENDTSVLFNREAFSATYDSKTQQTYVFGGTLAARDAIFSDFRVLDANFKVTNLNTPNVGRYGHTASLTSDGKIVVLGGVVSSTSGNTLASMQTAWVYTIASNSWDIANITAASGNVYPSSRSDHIAVVNSDDQIILFGGDSASIQRNRQYTNAIAILDTKTWTWTIPTYSGIPPSRRSYASGGLLDGKTLTVAFGESSNSYYNDINVFNLSTGSWLQQFGESSSGSSSGVSKGLIAGVTVAGVVLLLIILFLLWKFQSYVRWLVVRIHNDIWKPRTGEPVWAETSRIVSQVFFLFIFAMFLVFVIKQAIDSPNVTQRIESASATVDVPDVRFCFDGFPDQAATVVNGDNGAPGVNCQTDNGYSCTGFVQQLDMSKFTPTFADDLGKVNCFLFRAPSVFTLTSTSGANNGSRLLFTMFGDQSATSARVHVSVYPKQMDPNTQVYGISDDTTSLLSEADVLNWQTAERNDIQATNVYTIEPFTYSAMAYDLIDHRYLQSVGWNYVGFLPIYNHTPEIDSYFRSESPNPNYASGHSDLGLVAIFPNSFEELIDREVKMYTLVNALGFVGGIFGLLIAAQAWLFGYRPRSPWGVVHRWSTGGLKQSLLTGLQSKFKTSDSGIPLVHPVHHRFSVNDFQNLGVESEAQRVSRVEERMQVLELLFKAYYVDDEVFRSLDNANQNGTKGVNRPGAPAGPFFPSTEKIVPAPGYGDPNGFSHMFNEGHSRTSLSSDTNSHQNLNHDVHLRDMH